MFSTSTIASSTSSPIATAIPPSVITLIDSSTPLTSPTSLKTTTVRASESGIALSEMNVVRTFSRNRNRMTSTSSAPTTSASPTLYTPRSMKSRIWYRSVSTITSGGSEASTSRNPSLTASVSARVSTCGCFEMVSATAVYPLMVESPRLIWAPSVTRATSFRSTDRPSVLPASYLSGAFTVISRRSETTCSGAGPSRPITRIGVSVPPSTEYPPVWFTLFARSAASTS